MTKEAFELIFGEITGLQIVVQRLVAHLAIASGDMPRALAMDHEQASASLERTNFEIAELNVEAIRARAQSMLDDIYSTAATSRGSPS